MKELDGFIAGLGGEGNKRGLWMSGPRKVGLSRAVKETVMEHLDDLGKVRQATLSRLSKRVRDQWRYDGLLKANGNDYGLWEEADKNEKVLEDLWAADVIWIDDWYSEVEGPEFIVRNVLLPIDTAMKDGKTVIVTGTVEPKSLPGEWPRVIDLTFDVVRLALPA